jgi:hypothetical protein
MRPGRIGKISPEGEDVKGTTVRYLLTFTNKRAISFLNNDK